MLMDVAAADASFTLKEEPAVANCNYLSVVPTALLKEAVLGRNANWQSAICFTRSTIKETPTQRLYRNLCAIRFGKQATCT